MQLEREVASARSPTSHTVQLPGFVLKLGTHPARSVLARHHHEEPTICYVLRGGFAEYLPGERADCGATTLKVMPAGQIHWNRFGEVETHGLRIDVDPRRFGDAPAILRGLDERFHTTAGRAVELARRLAGELVTGDTATPIAAEGIALELVAELARRGRSAPKGPGTPRWLLAAEEVIRGRFRESLTVAELARVVEVHPATLSRMYRRRFGCTIGDRIRALRVEHAARELATTADRLSVIAVRAGFYDQSHFTNLFRRHYGVTPAAYRAAAR